VAQASRKPRSFEWHFGFCDGPIELDAPPGPTWFEETALTKGGYWIELEDSEADRIMSLKAFNEFIEWTLLRGSRPDFISRRDFMSYSPSIVDMLFPTQIELFPKTSGIGVTWLEDEYIPFHRPIK